MLFIVKKILKVIHPYYIISFVLIIVFVIIPSIFFSKQSSGLIGVTCKNICPNGEVEKIDDGICYCSDGQVIDPDKWYSEVENEK